MRTPDEEWADREDEARILDEYWRTHKGAGGRCALVTLALIVATVLSVAAGW